MFDPLTLNCHSIVNKFTVCMNSVLIFWWTDEQMFLPIWIDEIGKHEDKSINETSVSLISTDWSIQSISIKSDLPIFIDLSIDRDHFGLFVLVELLATFFFFFDFGLLTSSSSQTSCYRRMWWACACTSRRLCVTTTRHQSLQIISWLRNSVEFRFRMRVTTHPKE